MAHELEIVGLDRRLVRRALAIAYALALAVSVGVLVTAAVLDRPARYFTNEPSAILNGPWYAGWQANVTAVVWLSGASIALFAWATLDGRRASPLLWGGLLTAVMGADDLFLLHEELYPKLGISEPVAFLGYLGLMVAWSLRFRDELGRFGMGLVVLTLGCFAVSGLIDELVRTLPMVEDTTKLFGVASWTALMVCLSTQAVSATRRAGVASGS